MYFSYCMNPVILYMRFLTAQLNKTLIKKITDMNDVQNIRKYDFSKLFFLSDFIEPGPTEIQISKLKLKLYFIQLFSNDKE